MEIKWKLVNYGNNAEQGYAFSRFAAVGRADLIKIEKRSNAHKWIEYQAAGRRFSTIDEALKYASLIDADNL